ncbi:2-hydroxy-1,4-benzoquinone reductase [Polaribacter huanghezhanensis]|uniref:NADPH-dependent FMN reductase n=1 Tax=Polaribacter huanghezhanensis TaxID=1354726 RepID=UPI002649B5B5|nr:NADPH-dependent FMN reductase [Polaribacter huanghezhanensis]WKD84706.1 2-hydroxy-1,4-benzoquinone reductase [Polaribacter huanghezhanensis]
MKKILAFAGSTSTTSINKQLATYTASLVDEKYDVADLNDYQLPIFSIDIEAEGFPKAALEFNKLLSNYDGFVVSLAEHNGSYSAAFKNIFDWVSRIDRKVFKEKPVLLLATSPGARGGKSVLETAATTFPRMGANIVSTFSLPNFYDHFKNDEIQDSELKEELLKAIKEFQLVI